MKTAKLVKKGKGWRLEGEKPMSVPGDFGLTDDMEGQEVEFDNTGGPVKLIRYQGKDYTKIQRQDMGSKRDSRRQGNYGNPRHDRRSNPRGDQNQISRRQEKDPARAPYNFVPLIDKVVPTHGNNDHSKYSSLNGCINIQVKALTPLLVKNSEGQFFRVNDIPFIPGSTMRGLARNLVEIVSHSGLSFFENRQLYRRSNLTKDGNLVEAGFLTFSNGNFKIYKAQSRQEKRSNINSPHVYQFKEGTCTFSTGKFGHRLTIWKFSSREPNPIGQVPISIIESYNSDDTRSEGVIDIFKSARQSRICDKNNNTIRGNQQSVGSIGIPVFFRKDNSGGITSIGHAKYHRIPYSNSIGDHIDQDGVEADFGSGIFGTVNIAGKVFFEDFEPTNPGIKYELDIEKHPRILSSPKPTTYQHYLEQPNGIRTNQNSQHDWSTQDARIRGFKQYWHRKTSSKPNDPDTWIEAGEITNSHPNPINPVSVGSTFGGRIRFENLTEQELGALLFVLDLPEGCAHKLGMGKPLGLGSVKIAPKLTLIDRQKRYAALFDEKGQWATGVNQEENIQQFKDAFAQYIGEKVQNSDIMDADSYWTHNERMKELRYMLTLEHDTRDAEVDWNARTRYMEIEHPQHRNEYRGRPVLPKPSEVVNPTTYKKL